MNAEGILEVMQHGTLVSRYGAEIVCCGYCYQCVKRVGNCVCEEDTDFSTDYKITIFDNGVLYAECGYCGLGTEHTRIPVTLFNNMGVKIEKIRKRHGAAFVVC